MAMTALRYGLAFLLAGGVLAAQALSGIKDRIGGLAGARATSSSRSR